MLPIKPTTITGTTRQLTDIRPELLQIIYASIPLTITAILANSVILGFIQWHLVNHNTVLIWLSLTNGLSMLRLGIYRRFKKLDISRSTGLEWQLFILLSSGLSGLLWGLSAIFLFPPDDLAHQLFTVLVIAGMCAGAVTTLSASIRASIAFVVFATVPLFVQLVRLQTDIGHAMALMTLLFTVMMLITAKRLNRTIRESLFIRHEKNLAEETIQYQAYYDALTDLPNRRLLLERLKQETARSLRHNHIGAVIFIDLDHFKTINDTLGHAIGDELLKLVAGRITQRIRDEDTCARLGGDEFIILVPEAGDEADPASQNILALTEEILQSLAKPFDIDGQQLHISASIGITLFPFDNTPPEQLLQKSDMAMYEAKKAGGNRLRFFQPQMQDALEQRTSLEKDLRLALIENQFELYYQPLVDNQNKVFAVEALLRWKHPEKGLVVPDDFIEIAESNGLITSIGEWVLRQACEHQKQLLTQYNLTMCINVSPRQFSDQHFIRKVETILAQTGVNPENICLEITEGMVLDNIDETIDKMKLMAKSGLHFSIDDFGTGYSSLAYLKRLPVNALKIDRSFVMDINNDPNDAIIVETIIAMAHHMQIDVIAEGVETEEQFEFLRARGTETIQGYYVGKPMTHDEFVQFISVADWVASTA